MLSIDENVGGESLYKVMRRRRLTLDECLSVAIGLAEILRQLHATNNIHKIITPSNIIWNPENGQVRILDGGMALSMEDDELVAQTSEEALLPYTSPEQTGRMNRIVDYRSDFYSLGIILYEMLTGRGPFEAHDATEMVYCHIAREVTPPHLVDVRIPQVVSEIVLKLLAKMAEDRYQSARGLSNDLGRCRDQLRSDGKVTSFPIGQHDVSGIFHISQKLYGRDQEIKTLLSAFERVSAGRRELVLVAGYAGIGKTVLVDEVHKKVNAGHGFFVSGKYDQFTRNIPYSAIASAFGALMRQLLAEPEESLQRWKEALVSALKAEARVVIDVVPELELLIGAQPELEPLEPVQRRNRFRMVFQGFIRVFGQAGHPLVMFLDDLQWVDLASLDLLKDITTDPENRHLLIIGAYRDNEVPPEHHLFRAVDDIRKGVGGVLTLEVGPIRKQDLVELLADSFHADLSHVGPLGQLLLDKTAGNPFFLKQFLRTLYDTHLIGYGNYSGLF